MGNVVSDEAGAESDYSSVYENRRAYRRYEDRYYDRRYGDRRYRTDDVSDYDYSSSSPSRYDYSRGYSKDDGYTRYTDGRYTDDGRDTIDNGTHYDHDRFREMRMREDIRQVRANDEKSEYASEADDITALTDMAHHGRRHQQRTSEQRVKTFEQYIEEVSPRAHVESREPSLLAREFEPLSDIREEPATSPLQESNRMLAKKLADMEIIDLKDVDEKEFQVNGTKKATKSKKSKKKPMPENVEEKSVVSVELNPKRSAKPEVSDVELNPSRTVSPVQELMVKSFSQENRALQSNPSQTSAVSVELNPERMKHVRTFSSSVELNPVELNPERVHQNREGVVRALLSHPTSPLSNGRPSSPLSHHSLTRSLNESYQGSYTGRQGSPSRSRSPRNFVSNDSYSAGTREPLGMKDCDMSVERSLEQPEERMARSILNARIRQALRHGYSEDDEDRSLHTLQSFQQSLRQHQSRQDEEDDDESESYKEIGGGLDIRFVQQYEMAFELFMQQNISLMARNPQLIYNLRVAKLQKVLQVTTEAEDNLIDTIEHLKREKVTIVAEYKQKLVDAARKKAALEIHLRQELGTIQQATLEMQGKLTWAVIQKNDIRAKRHYKLLQQLSREKGNPRNLLSLLPVSTTFMDIREAAAAPACDILSDEQEKDLRQFQVDNSFLTAEVNVLEKKLAYEQALAKKYAWVDSLLIRMEPSHVQKLKKRYQKKLGATF